VADVERDDLVALPLELVGTPREAAADLVAHVAQALARAQLGVHAGRIAQSRAGLIAPAADCEPRPCPAPRAARARAGTPGGAPRPPPRRAAPAPGRRGRRTDSGGGRRSRSAGAGAAAGPPPPPRGGPP